MRFVRLPVIVLLFTFALANIAAAARITKSTDSGSSGEMRTVIEAAAPDSTITFAPNVHPVLTGRAVNVSASGIRIAGNRPQTVITRSFVSAEPVLSMRNGAGTGLMLENLAFKRITIQTGNSGIAGGGIVSVASTSENVDAVLGRIAVSRFDSNRVTLGNYLYGGGIVGAYSERAMSSIGDVEAVFSGNRVVLSNAAADETGKIWGGGLVGAFTPNQRLSSSIGNIRGAFFNNTVSTATYINGGGLVGAFVGIEELVPFESHSARIGNIAADFTRNHVIAHTNLSGGGLVGSWAWMGDVFIGDISGTFEGNTVTADSSYMRGGGLVGLRSYTGASVLGSVSASFLNNHITVGTSLGGGGIVGLYSANTVLGNRDLDKTSTIGAIDGARFIGNTVRVGSAGVENVYALGGVFAASGLDKELVVSNTIVRNNQLYLAGENIRDVGGMFYVGTDRDSANPAGHVLTLAASDGSVTEFRRNSLHMEENGILSSRSSSITFGREWDAVLDRVLDSRADAQLNISTQARGRVLLLDPIKVDMNGSRAFAMNVNGSGYFLWAGRNEMAAAEIALNFEAGITELGPDFEAVMNGNSAVSIAGAHTFRINVTGREPDLPFFFRPGSLAVTDMPALEGLYYGLDFAGGREWLVTDEKRWGRSSGLFPV